VSDAEADTDADAEGESVGEAELVPVAEADSVALIEASASLMFSLADAVGWADSDWLFDIVVAMSLCRYVAMSLPAMPDQGEIE